MKKRTQTATKDTNPKDAIAGTKLPLGLWPTTATALGCIAMLNGALKYGRQNWRASGVQASVYFHSTLRHFQAWWEGEEVDQDDGVPHLGAALAGIAILVDAIATGNLVDDRAYPVEYRAFVDGVTKHVARLQVLHAGRSPKHWTRRDAVEARASTDPGVGKVRGRKRAKSR